MKDLTTQTGIIVKCSKTAIEFFQNAQSVDFAIQIDEVTGTMTGWHWFK